MERAIAGADQPVHLKPQMFQHPADLAILAFGQRHFDPLVAAGAPFQIGLYPAIAYPVYLQPVEQILKLVLAHLAEGAGAIGARSEENTSELQSLMRISYAVF